MKDQWDNPQFALQWDQTTSKSNPARAEQLDLLVALLEETYQEGTAILDLGIGSGLVEALIFPRLPNAWVVGVDASSAMLSLATQRLQRYAKTLNLSSFSLAGPERMAFRFDRLKSPTFDALRTTSVSLIQRRTKARVP